MKDVALLVLLLVTTAAVQAQPVCPPLPTAGTAQDHLTVTADFLYFLYVDGQLTDSLPGYDNVTAPDTYDIPQYARLLAIQGQAFAQYGGILGSIQPNDYFLTGSVNWKCRNTLQNGWETLGFDDSSWLDANAIGIHGSYPGADYGCIAGISPNAHWIWTANNGPSPIDRNVWCRGYIPLCTANNPCKNGGTCLPNDNSRLCICPIDYTGETCETDLNQCRSSPCVNGGTCQNNVDGTFTCFCNANYTGSRCETMLNACESSPCINGGTCINGGAIYVCSCRPFYTGANCEISVPYNCGQILHQANNSSLPSGWDLGCYIGAGDEPFWSTPCFALLQGLSYYGSSDRLLEAGGNFGCWMTNNPSSSDVYNACADNYQQSISIRECSICNFLGVCIRFPKLPRRSRDEIQSSHPKLEN